MGAELAIFDGLDDGSHVFVEALLHLGKFFFEVLDAALLALDPLGAEFLSLFFEGVALGGHLLLHAV